MEIDTIKINGIDDYWIISWYGKKIFNNRYVPAMLDRSLLEKIEKWITTTNIECYFEKIDLKQNIWEINYKFKNHSHLVLFSLMWGGIIDNEWDENFL